MRHTLYTATRTVCFMLMSMLMSLSAHAEIYKWVDAEGNVHFSDKGSAADKARPVQLKSSINSYNGSSMPTFEYKAKNRQAAGRQQAKLPRLGPKQVVIYSTVWCGFCKKAKAYFRKRGIAFTEKDIEKSPQAKKEYQSLGAGGVPLILVGNKQGTRKLSGFSIARFDAAYQ